VNAVCEHCHTILDATKASLRVIQKLRNGTRVQRSSRWGPAAKPAGIYESSVSSSAIQVDGVTYQWSEYLCIKSSKLSVHQYGEHWDPGHSSSGTENGVRGDGETFKLFPGRPTAVFGPLIRHAVDLDGACWKPRLRIILRRVCRRSPRDDRWTACSWNFWITRSLPWCVEIVCMLATAVHVWA